MYRPIALILTLGLSGPAFATVPAPDIPKIPRTDGALMAVWTQFVAGDLTQQNAAIELRFVLMGAGRACTDVTLDQTPVGTAIAQPRGQMVGEYHKGSDEGSDKGSDEVDLFTVTVCSALLDPGTASVTLKDANGVMDLYATADPPTVPGPAVLGQASGDPSVVTAIALGDSGCRGMPGRGTQQDCATQWPLASLASDAAGLTPDIVLHVGDYHYFWEENPYWTDTSGLGPVDRFEYWLQEFLIPAGPLLRTAPWMLARGNHEQCRGAWFGDGWHTLFSPVPLNNMAEPCDPGVPATWAVDVQPQDKSVPSFRFVIVDTAQGQSSGFKDAAMHSVISNGGQSAWITHYPPLKMAHYNGQWNYGEFAIKQDIKDAYTPTPGGTPVATSACVPGKPCLPSAVFAGHQHFYQSFDFDASSGLPTVLIVGHGGTAGGRQLMPGASHHRTEATKCARDFARHMPFYFGDDTADASVETSAVHGFLHLTRSSQTAANPNYPVGWSYTKHWAESENVQFEDKGTCPLN